MNLSRRNFLQRSAAMSAVGLSLGAITRASAQGATDYKALVCLFLSGGNDAFNTVLATDTASWTDYLAARRPTDGSTGIALMAPGTAPVPTASASTPERLGGVLSIPHAGRAVHTGRQFALHPALTRVADLYRNGQAAVLANVGPLTRPTTKVDYDSSTASKPVKLFSHNDQQSTWMSFKPEGASVGWAGLMADTLRTRNGTGRTTQEADVIQRLFTCMTPTQASVWLAGNAVLPYQSSTTSIQALGSNGRIYGQVGLQNAMASIMVQQLDQGSSPGELFNPLAADHGSLVNRALLANSLLGTSLPALGQAPWSTTGVLNVYDDPLLKYTSPTDGTLKFNQLALQLQMVARLIETNRTANLGMGRQFFMVNLGGFDTHDNQVRDQAERLAQVDHAIDYFYRVLGSERGSQVTTFTASDFGRTFTSNGDGTDHGWGAHHFVVGGAVQGGEVYGTFPQYSTTSPTGEIHRGVLLPTTSVDQYAYTLGKWMGVSTGDLSALLPNLNQFNASTHDLAFMRA